MRASARELLVPFFTPLVWGDWGANPRSTASEADALTNRLSGPVTFKTVWTQIRPDDECVPERFFLKN